MDDAKVPPFRFHFMDERGKEIEPDWGMIVSNQISTLSRLSELVESQKGMLTVLNRIGDTDLHETLVSQREKIIEGQKQMITSVDNLSVKLDKVSDELEAAVIKLSISIMGIVQVPIAIALIAVASWAFFYKYIDQWVWLIIMAVACFRYLGDSINGVVKLISGIRKNGNGK